MNKLFNILISFLWLSSFVRRHFLHKKCWKRWKINFERKRKFKTESYLLYDTGANPFLEISIWPGNICDFWPPAPDARPQIWNFLNLQKSGIWRLAEFANYSQGDRTPALCRKLVSLFGDFLYGVHFNPAILNNKTEKKGIETISPFSPKMIRLQWMSPKFTNLKRHALWICNRIILG